MMAASGGQLEVARMMVNCGASSDAADADTGQTALHRAGARGHAEVLRLLLQAGASVDGGDFQGRTALILAAEEGHAEAIRTLLCAGASVTISDKEGETALAKCIRGGHEGCLEAMLKACAPVNAASRLSGDTGLICAARAGSKDMIRKLLQFQANVNISNNKRETPLMLAAGGGFAEITHLLLLAGADTTLQDLNGRTALMHGSAGGSPSTVSTCLDFGASPLFMSPVDASTALTVAATYGHMEVYKVLINGGAKVGAMEETPLEEEKNIDLKPMSYLQPVAAA